MRRRRRVIRTEPREDESPHTDEEVGPSFNDGFTHRYDEFLDDVGSVDSFHSDHDHNRSDERYDPEPIGALLNVLSAVGSTASIASVGLYAKDKFAHSKISESNLALTAIDLRKLEANCSSLTACVDELELLLRTSEGYDIGFEEAALKFGSFRPVFSPAQLHQFHGIRARANSVGRDSDNIIYGLLERAASGGVAFPDATVNELLGIVELLNKVLSHRGNLWEGMQMLREANVRLHELIAKMRAVIDRRSRLS